MKQPRYYMMLDSGAVSIYNRYVKKNTQGAAGRTFSQRVNEDYSFYKTDEYKKYRRAYIKYVVKYGDWFSGYINLDVINNAEASYKSLKFMEKKRARPLPVFHLGEDVKWLRRYIKEGYKFICVGGVTPNRFEAVQEALDRLFKDYFLNKDGSIKIRVHGLACTSFRLIKHYKWWSVDSTSWRKAAAYGKLFIPFYKKKKFDFEEKPFIIGTSFVSPTKQTEGLHYFTLPLQAQYNVKKWFDSINIPLGEMTQKDTRSSFLPLLDTVPVPDKKDKENAPEMKEWGVLSHHNARGEANMWYYMYLAERYNKRMFFAGSATLDSLPEEILKNRKLSGIMLTYFDVYLNHGCTTKRIEGITKNRKRRTVYE